MNTNQETKRQLKIFFDYKVSAKIRCEGSMFEDLRKQHNNACCNMPRGLRHPGGANGAPEAPLIVPLGSAERRQDRSTPEAPPSPWSTTNGTPAGPAPPRRRWPQASPKQSLADGRACAWSICFLAFVFTAGDYYRTAMRCQHGDAQDASCWSANPEDEGTIVP